jgi:carboxypeptidase T
MRRIFLLSFALAIIASFSPAQSQDTKIVSLPQTAAVLETAARLGLDLLTEIDGRVFIAASPSDLWKIEKLGLLYRDETGTLAPPVLSAGPESSASPIGAYHTHQELEDDLTTLQLRFPELAEIVVIGTSLENRPILALKVSDNPGADEGEPAVLFLGCHHAREWISVEVPFLFGRYLLENYGSDPEVRRLVDAAEIWIVPMVNPDGHDYTVRVYRYWRKNRRANDDGSFGVDLNRNYGTAWGYDDVGSSPDPAADVYRGTTAFSEPETQAVRNLILGRNFGSMISYHSYSQALMYPWGYTTVPTLQDALLHDLGLQLVGLMAAVNGREYFCGQSGTTLYLTNGDATDWSYAVRGMPAYTIELPPIDYLSGGFFNREEDIAPIFLENLPAMLALVDWTIAHPAPVPELSGRFSVLSRARRSGSGTIQK